MHGPFPRVTGRILEFSIWIILVEVDYQVLITHTMNLGRNLRHRVMMVLLGGPQDLTTFILPKFFLPSVIFQKTYFRLSFFILWYVTSLQEEVSPL